MSATGRIRYNPYSPGSSGWSISRNEEFQEVDVVWGTVTWDWERKEIDSYSTAPVISNSSIFSRRQPPSAAAALTIPKSTTISSSSSSPMMNDPNTFQQSSAPVNIPDWSKIHEKKPTGDGGGGGGDNKINSWDSDEDDEMTVPPHEWVARKLARSHISSFSLYEGVGRTLKGRDLSNMRNAVLTKTGFLE